MLIIGHAWPFVKLLLHFFTVIHQRRINQPRDLSATVADTINLPPYPQNRSLCNSLIDYAKGLKEIVNINLEILTIHFP
jgi:hypothetical protein